MKRAGAGLAVVGIIALVVFLLWPRGPRAREMAATLQTAQVKPADFYVSLRVAGALDAKRAHPVVCLTSRSNIVWILADGARVQAGDIILKLDAAELEKTVSDLQAQLGDAEEKVRSAQADGEKRLTNARSGMTKAEEALQLARTQNGAALEKAKAEAAFQEKELEVARGELEKRRRLAEERLIPLTELESAADQARQSELALKKAQRALVRAQENAAAVEELCKLDIEKAKLELGAAGDETERSVDRAQGDLEAKRVQLQDDQERLDRTQVKAPASGLLLLDRNWRGETLRVGDEVYEGRRVANVIDPAEMWVRSDIGEGEIEQVKVGQKAAVLVPALGNAELPGLVEVIDNLARQRRWWEGGVPGKKVFTALIELTDRDERLRPGMSASVEIRLEQVSEGLMVPVESLFEVGEMQVVYREEGGRYRAVPVEVGKRNDLVAVIEGEIKAGDRVAYERPPANLLVGAEGSK